MEKDSISLGKGKGELIQVDQDLDAQIKALQEEKRKRQEQREKELDALYTQKAIEAEKKKIDAEIIAQKMKDVEEAHKKLIAPIDPRLDLKQWGEENPNEYKQFIKAEYLRIGTSKKISKKKAKVIYAIAFGVISVALFDFVNSALHLGLPHLLR